MVHGKVLDTLLRSTQTDNKFSVIARSKQSDVAIFHKRSSFHEIASSYAATFKTKYILFLGNVRNDVIYEMLKRVQHDKTWSCH